MRPFDRTPTGFYAGEGGAALVLEARSHAEARGARIYGEYLGGAFAQQSWKHALPDAPSGRLSAAIREALRQAKLKPEQIDLVIPHGACSSVCDGYELQEMAKLWSDPAEAALCPVKPFVGHQLGNCVIIEIILALLMMQDGVVVGQPFKGSPVAQLPLAMPAENHAHDTKYMMKLATGFTGHDAALVFARA
jgi:3-oxoacyl-[acyl-carrier-protein] synthase II